MIAKLNWQTLADRWKKSQDSRCSTRSTTNMSPSVCLCLQSNIHNLLDLRTYPCQTMTITFIYFSKVLLENECSASRSSPARHCWIFHHITIAPYTAYRSVGSRAATARSLRMSILFYSALHLSFIELLFHLHSLACIIQHNNHKTKQFRRELQPQKNCLHFKQIYVAHTQFTMCMCIDKEQVHSQVRRSAVIRQTATRCFCDKRNIHACI